MRPNSCGGIKLEREQDNESKQPPRAPLSPASAALTSPHQPRTMMEMDRCSGSLCFCKSAPSSGNILRCTVTFPSPFAFPRRMEGKGPKGTVGWGHYVYGTGLSVGLETMGWCIASVERNLCWTLEQLCLKSRVDFGASKQTYHNNRFCSLILIFDKFG